jgi:hypothetical protein
MKKDFEAAGFTIQVKQLADFQDGYGLEAPEDGAEDEDEDEDMGSGSEGGSESEEE